MKTEADLKKAIGDMLIFNNTEIFRGVFTDEGKATMLDRIRLLRWVLEE